MFTSKQVYTSALRKGKLMSKSTNKVMELAANMTQDEAQALFDTGVFNPICRAYFAKVLDGIGVNTETRNKVLAALKEELEFTGAADAVRYYKAN